MTPSVPKPSDAALIRLATIAAYVEVALIPDQPVGKARIGLQTAKNDRRRAMEALLVLIADPEVRDYVAALQRLGLLPSTAA